MEHKTISKETAFILDELIQKVGTEKVISYLKKKKEDFSQSEGTETRINEFKKEMRDFKMYF